MFIENEITTIYSVKNKEELLEHVLNKVSSFLNHSCSLNTSIVNIDGLRESIEFKFNTIIMNDEWHSFSTINDLINHLNKHISIEKES